MKLRRIALFLFLLEKFSGCSYASMNDLSEYEQDNKTKNVYHVKIFDFNFTTEDKYYFEKNSVATAMNSE